MLGYNANFLEHLGPSGRAMLQVLCLLGPNVPWKGSLLLHLQEWPLLLQHQEFQNACLSDSEFALFLGTDLSTEELKWFFLLDKEMR